MGFGSHLIHTCVIQRATVKTDPYNNSGPDEWSDVDTVACRLVEKAQRVVNTERVESTVITTHLLLFGADADIRERDRVTNVTLDDGSLVTHVFEVTSLLQRRARALHHKSAALKVVE